MPRLQPGSSKCLEFSAALQTRPKLALHTLSSQLANLADKGKVGTVPEAYTYVRMYAFLYVCMYVCMHVCMHVYIYIHIYACTML